MDFWRRSLVLVLGLGVAGFGACSLCGGVTGIASLRANSRASGDYATLLFVCSTVAAVLAWTCWWSLRKLRNQPEPVSDAINPP